MPLENVFWPVGGAPHGTYVVRVNFYALCPGGAAAPAFTVRTVVDHALTTFDGTATTPDRPCDDCGTGDSPCACVDVTSFTR